MQSLNFQLRGCYIIAFQPFKLTFKTKNSSTIKDKSYGLTLHLLLWPDSNYALFFEDCSTMRLPSNQFGLFTYFTLNLSLTPGCRK